MKLRRKTCEGNYTPLHGQEGPTPRQRKHFSKSLIPSCLLDTTVGPLVSAFHTHFKASFPSSMKTRLPSPWGARAVAFLRFCNPQVSETTFLSHLLRFLSPLSAL